MTATAAVVLVGLGVVCAASWGAGVVYGRVRAETPPTAPDLPEIREPTHCEQWLREHVGTYKQSCPHPDCDGPPFTAAARHCPWCGTEVYDVQ